MSSRFQETINKFLQFRQFSRNILKLIYLSIFHSLNFPIGNNWIKWIESVYVASIVSVIEEKYTNLFEEPIDFPHKLFCKDFSILSTNKICVYKLLIIFIYITWNLSRGYYHNTRTYKNFHSLIEPRCATSGEDSTMRYFIVCTVHLI